MVQSQDQSLVHRELARRSQDIHRVRNPREVSMMPTDMPDEGFVNK